MAQPLKIILIIKITSFYRIFISSLDTEIMIKNKKRLKTCIYPVDEIAYNKYWNDFILKTIKFRFYEIIYEMNI
jgi:hypothetical protein